MATTTTAERSDVATHLRRWRYCARCVLPDTRPGLRIGADGVCEACANHAHRPRVDWDARATQLAERFNDARRQANGYDCVIPVSGGKDSTWQVATCLRHGLRVLAVTWRTPGRTSIGQQNLDNLIALGVDHIDYTINPRVERAFMRAALEKTGSTAVPMHMAMYAIPLRVATSMRIPLVIWGENPHQEYGRTDDSANPDRLDPDWGRRHGILQGSTPADWIGPELSRKDMEPYFGPDPEAFDAAGVQSIFLGDFLPWDPETSLRVAEENGFRRAAAPRVGLYDYADIDCAFISVHHHFKWLKFGFTRLFDNLALEIRNGRISREDAIGLIRTRGDQRPSADIDALCEFLMISKASFAQIEDRFRNRDIWRQTDGVWRIPGFLIDDWNWSC